MNRKEHAPTNQPSTPAVTSKTTVPEARGHLSTCAKRSKRHKFLSVLRQAPNVEPDDFDKL